MESEHFRKPSMGDGAKDTGKCSRNPQDPVHEHRAGARTLLIRWLPALLLVLSMLTLFKAVDWTCTGTAFCPVLSDSAWIRPALETPFFSAYLPSNWIGATLPKESPKSDQTETCVLDMLPHVAPESVPVGRNSDMANKPTVSRARDTEAPGNTVRRSRREVLSELFENYRNVSLKAERGFARLKFDRGNLARRIEEVVRTYQNTIEFFIAEEHDFLSHPHEELLTWLPFHADREEKQTQRLLAQCDGLIKNLEELCRSCGELEEQLSLLIELQDHFTSVVEEETADVTVAARLGRLLFPQDNRAERRAVLDGYRVAFRKMKEDVKRLRISTETTKIRLEGETWRLKEISWRKTFFTMYHANQSSQLTRRLR